MVDERRRLEDLERRVAWLEQRLRASGLHPGEEDTEAPAPVQERSPTAAARARGTHKEPAPIPSPPSAPAARDPHKPLPGLSPLPEDRPKEWVPVPAPSATPAPRPAQPATARPNLERLLGGNWLARAGVLVLALGVVFFLKMAYDRNWVPLAGRIAIGVLGGLALFATGEILLRRKFDSAYSQIVAGGGALIAYTTLYVAYALPNYRAALHVALPVEVGLLASVAALLGAYAVWRNLPVLAGVAMGLSALLVAPAGDFSSVGLLFVSLLGAGLLYASVRRGWQGVVMTGVLGLNVAFLAASRSEAIAWQLVAVLAVLIDGLAVVAASRSSAANDDLPRTEAGIAVAALFLVLSIALSRGHVPHAMGWTLLGLGLATLMACFPLRRLAPVLGIEGAVLLLAWPLVHLQGVLPQALAYGVLAAGAWGASLRLPKADDWIRVGALAAAALGAFLLMVIGAARHTATAHPWEFAGLSALFAGVGGALWTTGPRDEEGEAPAGWGLAVAGAVLFAWPLVAFETALLRAFAHVVIGLLVWAVARQWAPGRRWLDRVALGACAVAALVWAVEGFAVPGPPHEPLFFAALAVLLVALAVLVHAAERKRPSDGTSWSSLGLGLAVLAAWPLLQFPGQWGQTVMDVGLGLVLAAASRLWAPLRQTLWVAAGLLVALGAISVLALGMGSHLVDRQPLLSMAAAGGVTALAVALAAMPTTTVAEVAVRRAGVAAAALALVAETGQLLDGWRIAVSWAVIALAFAGAGLAARHADARKASLALFGLVLVRLFLLDFSGLSLPSRVLAFLITGALLLVAAFLYARAKRGPPVPPPAPPLPPET